MNENEKRATVAVGAETEREEGEKPQKKTNYMPWPRQEFWELYRERTVVKKLVKKLD